MITYFTFNRSEGRIWKMTLGFEVDGRTFKYNASGSKRAVRKHVRKLCAAYYIASPV